ncbi:MULTISPECIES: DUF4174 domain-containing protein [Rhizobium]|uniref:DUF4174 domain-containing protein n=1 Tax=Rhizobium TaxID=379 RepID=UPI0003829F39|nr:MULTISPECIES: DUF4174 domain-containing protein [unclassified Rhizobium]MBD9445950.1 DUF4174 domain-containing protein [Rhizobium sp. RHZ01]MBD9454538.1 DUF4174 domain-containing protein [Rhizobium sp. RHZ02]NMN70273.1 uncharacterized protein DUF4174 [Rhizobium sp. 57MFTsu3.2]
MSKTLLYGATKVDEGNEAYSAIASLEQFQWRNRVLVIFADKGNARAARQENQLLADRDALQDRDMVILKIVGGSVRELFGAGEKLDAAAIARDLGDPTAGEFAAFLVGKDGTVKLKVSEPVTSAELFAIIDSMPVRAAEVAAEKQQTSEESEKRD